MICVILLKVVFLENRFMRIALDEARVAEKCGEMPVGAVVVRNGEVIGKGHNIRSELHDPTLHAEIVAIRQACQKLSDWRLDECDIYITLEPCVMCSGAIINSRMRSVYFGAYDPEYGAAGGRIDLFSKSYFGSKTVVYGGIMEAECKEFLASFFKRLRNRNN